MVTAVPEWEVYRGQRRPGPAVVRLSRAGRSRVLAFSAAAWEHLGRPAAVVYLTDAGERVIAFRPAKRGEADAYAVSGPGHAVSATAVARFMGDPPPGVYRLRGGNGLPPHISLTDPDVTP